MFIWNSDVSYVCTFWFSILLPFLRGEKMHLLNFTYRVRESFMNEIYHSTSLHLKYNCSKDTSASSECCSTWYLLTVEVKRRHNLSLINFDTEYYTHLHLVPRWKNAWSYTFTPPIRLHGLVKVRDNFTFTFRSEASPDVVVNKFWNGILQLSKRITWVMSASYHDMLWRTSNVTSVQWYNK
jgi:hypothetical protein